ncbi:MAG: CDP-alcohol phosphatidyltransferase family protein [Deltaproteobacteria bacterium]|nr:CDP-alcohol phosphatidyltransferase family protein [Deltaproteobacteria bacterium]
MSAYDFVNTIVLLGILALVGVAYSVKLILKGRTQYDRVNRQGGSVLMGRGMMEIGYWALQPIAKLLVFLHVTPNQISWASLVFGGLAGTALVYGYFGFAALFSCYSAFMDCLDGMVARMTEVASDAGEVLDAAVDRYVEFFFLAGLVIYYREFAVFQLIALAALAGSFMVSYSTAKAEALHIPPPPGIMRRPERAFYLTLGAALSTFSIPQLDAYFNFSKPVGYPLLLATFAVAVLANIAAIERLWTIGRAVREREAAAQLQELDEVASEHGEVVMFSSPEDELTLNSQEP